MGRIGCVVVGVALALFGLWVFVAPRAFFTGLPDYYGEYNVHFVRDAGLAFLGCGLLYVAAAIVRPWQAPLAIAAAVWLVLHALFHVGMIATGMVPGDWIRFELTNVILPSVIASFATAIAVREARSA